MPTAAFGTAARRARQPASRSASNKLNPAAQPIRNEVWPRLRRTIISATRLRPSTVILNGTLRLRIPSWAARTCPQNGSDPCAKPSTCRQPITRIVATGGRNMIDMRASMRREQRQGCDWLNPSHLRGGGPKATVPGPADMYRAPAPSSCESAARPVPARHWHRRGHLRCPHRIPPPRSCRRGDNFRAW